MQKSSTEDNRLLWIRGVVLLVCMVTLGCLWVYGAEKRGGGTCDTKRLCVAFLDVGQGDAIYIHSPSGQSMLVDGGRDAAVLKELPRVIPGRSHHIDYVAGTHPDADHIGGLAQVVARYSPAHVLTVVNEKETYETQALNVAIEAGGVDRTTAHSGQVYDLGSGVTVTVLYPFHDMPKAEANDASMVFMVSYGESDIVLTGDAPLITEYYLRRAYGAALQAEVLKLGHHGSRTSSGADFLKAVAPQFGVISAGKDNTYGHPHAEVVNRSLAAGVTLASTVENGTMVLETDGETIEVRRLEGE